MSPGRLFECTGSESLCWSQNSDDGVMLFLIDSDGADYAEWKQRGRDPEDMPCIFLSAESACQLGRQLIAQAFEAAKRQAGA